MNEVQDIEIVLLRKSDVAPGWVERSGFFKESEAGCIATASLKRKGGIKRDENLPFSTSFPPGNCKKRYHHMGFS
jgi:hypothetical protein